MVGTSKHTFMSLWLSFLPGPAGKTGNAFQGSCSLSVTRNPYNRCPQREHSQLLSVAMQITCIYSNQLNLVVHYATLICDPELLFSATSAPRESLDIVQTADSAPCRGLLCLPSPAQRFLQQGTGYTCIMVNKTRAPDSVKSALLFLKLLVEIETNGTERSDTVGSGEAML